jgi:hypothetical protein
MPFKRTFDIKNSVEKILDYRSMAAKKESYSDLSGNLIER